MRDSGGAGGNWGWITVLVFISPLTLIPVVFLFSHNRKDGWKGTPKTGQRLKCIPAVAVFFRIVIMISDAPTDMI